MQSFLDNVTRHCNRFNNSMATTFPGFIAKASLRNIIGPVVLVEFANVATVAEAPNGIIQNASIHMRFLLSLTGSDIKTPLTAFEITSPGLDKGLRDQGVKYRVIKGATPEECLQKLAAWFYKNEEAIKAVKKA